MHEVTESRHKRVLLEWLRRILKDKSGWKPPAAEPDGWYLTKDDRKRAPRELRLVGQKASDRDAAWNSMFQGMASAIPPRAYLMGGDPNLRGTKVRIPRKAVFS
jgi:hypothetical protein